MIRINLSTILGKKRMSQAELSRKTGIRASTINDMYHELSKYISLDNLDKICMVLKCDLTDIIEYIPNNKIKHK